ncbi:phosphoribosylaminoimidazolesuccinocarboxamide synthase [bacterium]|nr:phosphoribosylaminoimidazolesuccinocarboxamide synthase [bacterium]
MISRPDIIKQLNYTLKEIDLPWLGVKYRGKVRDCYTRVTAQGRKERILIATDRLSAFDVVLSSIPFKGAVLSGIAKYWFDQTRHIVPNHVLSTPHPNVFIGHELEIVPIEVVVRAYLTGSAWRDYEAGRAVSGIELPRGMKKHQAFAQPILTPSTKEAVGKHDLPIASNEIVKRGITTSAIWGEICEKALKVFAIGQKLSQERGLILVDTKYEFGILRKPGGAVEVYLADEIHTPDSSRYWIADSYADRFAAGEDPEMLDKEFLRRWLIARGYMGEGVPPILPDDFRVEIAERYLDLYQRITGQSFDASVGDTEQEIAAVLQSLGELSQ